MTDNFNNRIYSKQTTLLIVDAEETRSVSVNTQLLQLLKPLVITFASLLILSFVIIAYLLGLTWYKSLQVEQAEKAKLEAQSTASEMIKEVNDLKNKTSQALATKLQSLSESEQTVEALQRYLKERGVSTPALMANPNIDKQEGVDKAEILDKVERRALLAQSNRNSKEQRAKDDNDLAASITTARPQYGVITPNSGGQAATDEVTDIQALQKVPYMQDYALQVDSIFDIARRVPIGLPHHGAISSRFGPRHNPFGHGPDEFHHGLDFKGQTGAPITATADGRVVIANRQNGYGLVVKIQHGYGYMTVYGHLSKINVKAGAKVKANDVIGDLGSTGRSTGPHLHYEVRRHNVALNPEHYLSLNSPAPQSIL